MATFRAMKGTLGRMQRELNAERQRLAAIHGNIYDDVKKQALGGMEDAGESAMPMVRPGDASVAAPFTSRSPSVRNIVDLIRQGRCTLLSPLEHKGRAAIPALSHTLTAPLLPLLPSPGARCSRRCSSSRS